MKKKNASIQETQNHRGDATATRKKLLLNVLSTYRQVKDKGAFARTNDIKPLPLTKNST